MTRLLLAALLALALTACAHLDHDRDRSNWAPLSQQVGTILNSN